MSATNETHPPARKQAILVAVQSPTTTDQEIDGSLDELENLVAGLGMQVEARFTQRREQPAAGTYLGEGKLREIAALTGGSGEVTRGPAKKGKGKDDEGERSGAPREDAVVIVNDDLTAAQARGLEKALGVPVLDRTTVILRVFQARARTREAMLEIELAQLEYELPRVREDRSLGDREGGGGRAARGHSNVELAKQRIRERIAALRKELEHQRLIQEQQRRGRSETFSAALVGYTNAGKSSLMRLLTGSDVLVENKLFATLGTTIRPLKPAAVPPVLLVDTVGFIDRLPHGLIASFRATLAEARQAWLLLHVVDASDPSFRTHMRVTESVLEEIGAGETPMRLVLNKIDRLSDEERAALAEEFPDAVQVCAHRSADGQTLRSAILGFFDQHLAEETFAIPYAKQGVLASMRDQVRVLREEFGDCVEVTVSATPGMLGKLRKQLA